MLTKNLTTKIRAVYSYEVTILTLVSSLGVAWALLTYAMERFNVFIPWQNILVCKEERGREERRGRGGKKKRNIRKIWSLM
jgi:hypothetical protein